MADSFLEEIEVLQAKIDALSQKRSFPINNIHLQTGMFFFLVFLLSILQKGTFFSLISLLSFIILSLGFLKTSADIFYYKKSDTFLLILSIIILIFVGFSYYALWSLVLVKNSLLFLLVFGIIIFLSSLFYLIHGYLSYRENKAKKESKITALVIALNWFIFLLNILYTQAILYLLLCIATIFLVKTVYDFSQHFVRREE